MTDLDTNLSPVEGLVIQPPELLLVNTILKLSIPNSLLNPTKSTSTH